MAWLLALTGAACLGATIYFSFVAGARSLWPLTIGGALAALVPLALYQRGHEWARVLPVAGLVIAIVAFTDEPYLTGHFTITLLVPPVFALIVADARWVVGSAAVTFLGLLARGGPQSIYLQPDGVILVSFLVGGMALARQLTDAARRRAEDQARLLDEERRLLEQRVEERTRELAEANAELREASKAKNLFLAAISHELRTPLNIILGNTELLRDEVYGPLAPRQVRALTTVEESSQHLLRIINDLLDLTRLQAGSFSIDSASVSVSELCVQSARLIRTEVERKGLRFDLDIDPAARRVYGDAQRIRQILLNLLQNAVKFTPPGGQIALTARPVEDGRQVEFVVHDTGIGIAENHLDRLFQPFSQVDRSLSRAYGGTGLGLALVSQLAALHGGTVGVDTAPGEGSRFWVRLPAEGGEAPRPEERGA